MGWVFTARRCDPRRTIPDTLSIFKPACAPHCENMFPTGCSCKALYVLESKVLAPGADSTQVLQPRPHACAPPQVIVIYESVRPQLTILWRIPGTTIYRNVKQEPCAWELGQGVRRRASGDRRAQGGRLESSSRGRCGPSMGPMAA